MSRFNKRKYLIDGCPRRAKTILSTYKGLDLKVSNGMKQFLFDNQPKFETLVNMYHDTIFDTQDRSKFNLWLTAGLFYKYKDHIVSTVIIPDIEKREALISEFKKWDFVSKYHNLFTPGQSVDDFYKSKDKLMDFISCEYLMTEWYGPAQKAYDTMCQQLESPEFVAVQKSYGTITESQELNKLRQLNYQILDSFSDMNDMIVGLIDLIVIDWPKRRKDFSKNHDKQESDEDEA